MSKVYLMYAKNITKQLFILVVFFPVRLPWIKRFVLCQSFRSDGASDFGSNCAIKKRFVLCHFKRLSKIILSKKDKIWQTNLILWT